MVSQWVSSADVGQFVMEEKPRHQMRHQMRVLEVGLQQDSFCHWRDALP